MKNPFKAIGNFFTKTVGAPVRSFFTKTIPQAAAGVPLVLQGIGHGAANTLKTVGGIGSKLLGNPITVGLTAVAAPELLPAVMAAGSASKIAKASGNGLEAASQGRPFKNVVKSTFS